LAEIVATIAALPIQVVQPLPIGKAPGCRPSQRLLLAQLNWCSQASLKPHCTTPCGPTTAAKQQPHGSCLHQCAVLHADDVWRHNDTVASACAFGVVLQALALPAGPVPWRQQSQQPGSTGWLS
jgi:hypothetical protein